MVSPIPRRAVLVVVLASVVTTACVSFTDARANSLAQVDVYDRGAGEALPEYRHRGRSYIEGRPGNEYAVRIRNNTAERLLAVLSVDGVNAVTGETASPDQSGYVIEPWGYVTVQGWRKGLDRTAAFYFSDPQDSYAARTGRPDDLGVIGVALFRERVIEPHGHWWSRDDRSPGYPSAREKAFERASSRPDEVVALRYERRETLVALGVLPAYRHGWRRDPDPFPGTLGFVPDP